MKSTKDEKMKRGKEEERFDDSGKATEIVKVKVEVEEKQKYED
jgi:hypothetical protein